VGYLQPDSGTIELDGENVFDNPLAASARIGYLPELNPLYNEMTVEEFLRFIAALRKMKEPYLSERLEFVRDNCGLDEVWKQKIGTLSKGYRQRTGLAQAIIHNPDLLILDEPTSGLDPNQILEIRDLIRELGENKTVILSSHIMQEVQALCSRVIIIHKGQIIVDDSIENLSSYISETTQIVLELEAENPDFQPWLEQYPQVQLTDIEPKDDHLALRFTIPIEMDLRKELSALYQSRAGILSVCIEKLKVWRKFSFTHFREPFYTEEEEKEEEGKI
jgi:ABC-2 type transport system ATP-binding protein